MKYLSFLCIGIWDHFCYLIFRCARKVILTRTMNWHVVFIFSPCLLPSHFFPPTLISLLLPFLCLFFVLFLSEKKKLHYVILFALAFFTFQNHPNLKFLSGHYHISYLSYLCKIHILSISSLLSFPFYWGFVMQCMLFSWKENGNISIPFKNISLLYNYHIKLNFLLSNLSLWTSLTILIWVLY